MTKKWGLLKTSPAVLPNATDSKIGPALYIQGEQKNEPPKQKSNNLVIFKYCLLKIAHVVGANLTWICQILLKYTQKCRSSDIFTKCGRNLKLTTHYSGVIKFIQAAL